MISQHSDRQPDEIGGASMRERFGDPSVCSPLSLEEGIRAAWILDGDKDIPFGVLLVGLALEFTSTAEGCQRRRVAKALGMPLPVVRTFELCWEGLDGAYRFEVVRRAIRITLARRCRA